MEHHGGNGKAAFPRESNTFFARGGHNSSYQSSIFAYTDDRGGNYADNTFRLVLAF